MYTKTVQTDPSPAAPAQAGREVRRAEERAATPTELCAAVGEVIAQHARRGDLLDDVLRALDAAKRTERQTAACLQALTRYPLS